jgi:hypothetical protein
MVIAPVIERPRRRDDGSTHEHVDAPGIVPDDRTECVEALSDIRTFADRHETTGAELELLPATAKTDASWIRSGSYTHLGISLMDVEPILIRTTRASGAARLDPTLQLAEEAKSLA